MNLEEILGTLKGINDLLKGVPFPVVAIYIPDELLQGDGDESCETKTCNCGRHAVKNEEQKTLISRELSRELGVPAGQVSGIIKYFNNYRTKRGLSTISMPGNRQRGRGYKATGATWAAFWAWRLESQRSRKLCRNR